MQRFATHTNAFQKDYAENAQLLQKKFNREIIYNFVQYLLREKPSCTRQPLKILDLCCGDGESTYALLAELDKYHIEVEKITGLDISAEQIERARIYSARDPRLEFKEQDIEKINDAKKEYHIVTSFFGLHWVEDLPATANRISSTLTDDGLVLFFVPLEKAELFNLRQQLMSSPAWQDEFLDFTIHPFIDTHRPYLESFSHYFSPAIKGGIAGDQPVNFTKENFIRFLSSWMQEVRYLHDKDKSDRYLSELIDRVVPTQQGAADVSVSGQDDKKTVTFLEKYFWFFGP